MSLLLAKVLYYDSKFSFTCLDERDTEQEWFFGLCFFDDDFCLNEFEFCEIVTDIESWVMKF